MLFTWSWRTNNLFLNYMHRLKLKPKQLVPFSNTKIKKELTKLSKTIHSRQIYNSYLCLHGIWLHHNLRPQRHGQWYSAWDAVRRAGSPLPHLLKGCLKVSVHFCLFVADIRQPSGKESGSSGLVWTSLAEPPTEQPMLFRLRGSHVYHWVGDYAFQQVLTPVADVVSNVSASTVLRCP